MQAARAFPAHGRSGAWQHGRHHDLDHGESLMLPRTGKAGSRAARAGWGTQVDLLFPKMAAYAFRADITNPYGASGASFLLVTNAMRL
jgi:hypothetical protein